jgi:uncharacterized membrane protein (UPF0127 family)
VKIPLFNIIVAIRAFAVTTAVMLAFVACSSGYPQPVFIESPDCAELTHGVLPVTNLTLSIDGRDIPVQVEVANNSSKRTQGLMCRESITAGTGMLFTYTSDRTNGFWMFNTYTGIDIIFIDKSGGVADQLTMSPCPRESEEENDDQWKVRCGQEAINYIPEASWRYVLELPNDWLADQNIGDSIVREMNVNWPEAIFEEE